MNKIFCFDEQANKSFIFFFLAEKSSGKQRSNTHPFEDVVDNMRNSEHAYNPVFCSEFLWHERDSIH